MYEGEEFLFRPVLRGMFSADKLIDASSPVNLAFVALCNEALDVEGENMLRAQAAAKRKAAAAAGTR